MGQRYILPILLALCSFVSWASDNPVKVSSHIVMKSEHEGVINICFDISDGWRIYDNDVADGGPVATTIEFSKLDGVTLIGRPEADVASRQSIDVLFNLKLGQWTENVTFSQKFQLLSDSAYKVEGKARFMSCSDDMPMPVQTIDFSVDGINDKITIDDNRLKPSRKEQINEISQSPTFKDANQWQLFIGQYVSRETAIVIIVMLLLLSALWLLGMIKVGNYNNGAVGISVGRFFAALLSISLAIYMLPGLWGAPLDVVAELLPPMTSQDFVIENI